MPNYPYYQQLVPQMGSNRNGFICVPNEETVYNYPIAPGNCVTFKIDNSPVVLEKSMGMSQFETPQIKRFRLVEEEVTEPKVEHTDYEVVKEELELLKSEFEKIRGEVDALKPKKTTKRGSDGED